MIHMRLSKLFLPLYTIALATSCSGTTVAPDATSVSFESDTYVVEVGKSITLKAKVSPTNAKDKELSWSIISGTSYASLDNGVVTGKAEGTARIRARLKSNSKLYDICTVTVLDEIVPVTGISFESTTVEVMERKYTSLTPVISPSNASNKNVTWKSSNTSVATVTDGSIRGLKKGSATITATTQDGGFSASATVTVTENTSTADAWTVLVYMCGSTLESDYANKSTQGISYDKCGLAVCDIKEILSTPNKPDDVNIVFETGGANTWTTNANGKYSDGYTISNSFIQRHHVEGSKIVLDDEQDKITNEKMGKGEVLQSFLEYGLTHYPADKTALILWNHGGAMQGVCFNDAGGGYCDDDGLEASEVASATKAALKNCGMEGEKLEWIGYDACLMGVQDIAEMNSPYFNYMVASEELENGEGWDYDTWLDDLYAGKDTPTILKAIVDGFITENGGTSRSNDQTLAYYDLKYASDYMTAWENMAKQLKNKITSSNKDDFNDLVESAKYYGGDQYTSYGTFDALDFVNKLSNDSTFNPGSTYIQAVKTARAKLVPYSSCGGGAGNSNGIAMYWSISSTCKSYNPYTAGTDTHFTNWAYLSNKYYGSGSSGGWGGWDWDW